MLKERDPREIELPKECAQLKQIGKSNNSLIYKQINKEQEEMGHVLKLIIHQSQGQHQKECQHLQNEHKLLLCLKHDHIISVKQKYHSMQLLKKVEICGIELERGEADLFDKMSKMYPEVLKPREVRQYFRQIAEAVDYLHQLGISHNDIKLENIILFENGKKVKIADFGFARDHSKCNYPIALLQRKYWANRCKTMLAPEVIDTITCKKSASQEECIFDEFKADVFAFGVTLFQALFLRTPFSHECAQHDDFYFMYFYRRNFEKYWNISEIQNIIRFLSKADDLRLESLKDLFENVLEVDPARRFTMQQVLSHPWFAQPENSDK